MEVVRQRARGSRGTTVGHPWSTATMIYPAKQRMILFSVAILDALRYYLPAVVLIRLLRAHGLREASYPDEICSRPSLHRRQKQWTLRSRLFRMCCLYLGGWRVVRYSAWRRAVSVLAEERGYTVLRAFLGFSDALPRFNEEHRVFAVPRSRAPIHRSSSIVQAAEELANIRRTVVFFVSGERFRLSPSGTISCQPFSGC